MPCYEPRDEHDAQIFNLNRDKGVLQHKLDERTDMLCRVLSHFSHSEIGMETLPEDVKKWWKEHQAWDKKRGNPS